MSEQFYFYFGSSIDALTLMERWLSQEDERLELYSLKAKRRGELGVVRVGLEAARQIFARAVDLGIIDVLTRNPDFVIIKQTTE